MLTRIGLQLLNTLPFKAKKCCLVRELTACWKLGMWLEHQTQHSKHWLKYKRSNSNARYPPCKWRVPPSLLSDLPQEAFPAGTWPITNSMNFQRTKHQLGPFYFMANSWYQVRKIAFRLDRLITFKSFLKVPSNELSNHHLPKSQVWQWCKTPNVLTQS